MRKILGYPSVREMCRQEKISPSAWTKNRRRFSGTDESILRRVKSKVRYIPRQCIPTLGFRSKSAALAAHSLSVKVWDKAKAQLPPGASDEEILKCAKERKTKAFQRKRQEKALGIPTLGFPSVKAMCLHYGIRDNTWLKTKKRYSDKPDKWILIHILENKERREKKREKIVTPERHANPLANLVFTMPYVERRKTNY